MAPKMMAVAAVVLLLGDLGSQIRRFIVIDERGADVFAAHEVVRAVRQDAAGTTQPWRIVPLGRVYMDDYLMEHRVRSVLGYHGNEPHTYDETLGGKNQWGNLADPQAWRLLGVRYLVLDQAPTELPPGFEVIGRDLQTWLGERATVLRIPNPAPWAVVAPLAFKLDDEGQTIATAMNPQFDPSRIVLLAGDASFGNDTPPEALPPAISPAPTIAVEERQPGVYALTISGLEQDGFLVVSENHLPSWTATVDGVAAPTARANGTFLAVPVQAGTREVVLAVEARGDARGLRVSFAGVGGLILLALSGLILKRRQDEGAA
jgi:hypothetical protein